MKNWFSRNYKTIIISAFLIPIITVALVSISHVTKWYGISNPVTWAIYLSIGIEIAALSALAAISANMGKKVYFPFGIVTLVQFIGNIYFAYSYIDVNTDSFKSWVELVAPFVEVMGVDPTDFVGHKRFLAFFAGGMLPLISLSFLHMLVKFTEEDRLKEKPVDEPKPKEEIPTVEAKDVVAEVSRFRPTEEDLKNLEQFLEKLKPKEETQQFETGITEKDVNDLVFDDKKEEPIKIDEEILEKIREQYEEREDYGNTPTEPYEKELDGFDGFVTPEVVEEQVIVETPVLTQEVVEPTVPEMIETPTPEVTPEETIVEEVIEKPYGFEYTQELDNALNNIQTPEPTPTPEIVEETSEPEFEDDMIEITFIPEVTPEEIVEVIPEPELTPEVEPEPVFQESEIIEETPQIEDTSLPTETPEEEKKN